MEKRANELWSEIRERYAEGGVTHRELADAYDVPLGALRKKAAQEHWSQDRKSRAEGGVDDTSAQSIRRRRQLELTDRLLELVLTAMRDDKQLLYHVSFCKATEGSEFICQPLGALDDERLLRLVKAATDICELQRTLLDVHPYRDVIAARKLEQDGALASRKLDIELLKLEGASEEEQSPEEFLAALLGADGQPTDGVGEVV